MTSEGNTAGAVVGSILGVAIVVGAFFYYKYRYSITGGEERIRKDYNIVHNPLVDDDVVKVTEEGRIIVSPARPEKGGIESIFFGEDEKESFEPVVLEGILKAGYLYKKATSLKKDWLRRWFFLKEAKLFYIQRPTDLIGMTKIDAVLVANLLVSTVKEMSKFEFQIISPGQRRSQGGGGIYELKGDDEEDVADWVATVRSQIKGSLDNASSIEEGVNPGDSLLKLTTLDDATLLHLRTQNPVCVDCDAENPEWASVNLCVMMCIECSGIHRSLGSHVSKVRSLRMDKLTENTARLLSEVGNSRANNIWEAQLSTSKLSSSATREQREKFICEKYVKRQFQRQQSRSRAAIDARLLSAARAGSLLDVMAALAAGADVNAPGPQDHALRCPLHLAAAGNHPLCVELLCLCGAALDEIDAAGRTPLDLAVDADLVDVQCILLGYNFRAGSARSWPPSLTPSPSLLANGSSPPSYSSGGGSPGSRRRPSLLLD